jgi:hypothetical protein
VTRMRSLSINLKRITISLPARAHFMSSASITHEIAQQTALLNELRLKQAEPSSVDQVKKKLGELKKSLAQLNSNSHAGKDAAKKRERMLLKTAKVGISVPDLTFVQTNTRAHEITDP